MFETSAVNFHVGNFNFIQISYQLSADYIIYFFNIYIAILWGIPHNGDWGWMIFWKTICLK